MLYRLFKVNSWEEYQRLTDKLNSHVFRGQSDSSWDLETTLRRKLPCSLLRMRRPFESEFRRHEEWSFQEFEKLSHLYFPKDTFTDKRSSRATIMQHYGIPTRMLDFSRSASLAAYFALECAEEHKCTYRNSPDEKLWPEGDKIRCKCAKKSVAIWAINRNVLRAKVNDFLANKLNPTYCPCANEKDWTALLDRFLDGQGAEFPAVFPVYSSMENRRSYAQQSVFLFPTMLSKPFEENLRATLENNSTDDAWNCLTGKPEQITKEVLDEPLSQASLVKIIIDESEFGSFMQALNKNGITGASLYDGIQGIARSMAHAIQFL